MAFYAKYSDFLIVVVTGQGLYSYFNPIGMDFEETFQSEEPSASCIQVVQNLSKHFGLLVVLQKTTTPVTSTTNKPGPDGLIWARHLLKTCVN